MSKELQETYEFFGHACTTFFADFRLTERDGRLDKVLAEFCKKHDEHTAEAVYDTFLYTYRSSGLQEIIDAMRKFEVLSSPLIAHQRDHYIHTVNVFLLGLSMYVHNENVRKLSSETMNYPDMYPDIKEEFLYRWGMASLFHDVGYPLEIAYKTICEFMSKLIVPNLSCNEGEIVASKVADNLQDPIAILRIRDLENLLYINILPPAQTYEGEYYQKYPQIKTDVSNDLLYTIAKNISHMGFASANTIHGRLKGALGDGLKKGLIDHAIYSAIVFLKWTNTAFSKAKWNPAYYYHSVVDSATAIFLHNAYNYIFREPPFNLPALDIKDNILSFLLILCDKIQETDRVSYGYDQKGVTFTRSYFKIDDHELALMFFTAREDDNTLAQLQVDHMFESIKNTLNVRSLVGNFKIEVTVDK